MPKCEETPKATKKANALDGRLESTYKEFVKDVKAKGFEAAVSEARASTGGKKKSGKNTWYEVYLWGKRGNPVPPRLWVEVEPDGDVKILDIADHRGH